MDVVVSGLMIVAGMIHILPVSGVVGARHLQRLYGVAIADPDLLMLMRHRAVLFALLGAALIAGAVDDSLFWPAVLGGLVSTVAFLLLATTSGPRLRRVVAFDVLAIVCLALAALINVAT